MNNIESIINENQKLIFSIVKEFGYMADKDDLYQVAVIGIISANKNYNEEYGVKFSTYAYKYILGEIKKYLRESKGIKVNNETNSLVNKIKKAKSMLSQKLMKEPSISDISNFLEIDYKIIENALLSENSIVSLESTIKKSDNELTLYDIIPSNDNTDILEYLNLKNEIYKLEEPYKSILMYRYYKDKSQSEVAKLLGLSQVNISRYENKVLKKLKNRLCV